MDIKDVEELVATGHVDGTNKWQSAVVMLKFESQSRPLPKMLRKRVY